MPIGYLAAILMALSCATSAQAHHHDVIVAQSQHRHGNSAPSASASTKAFEAASAKMHRDMAIKYSGDADADFVRGMIPHHQGAIDMAKVVLTHGNDPEIRKLAEDIIKAQEGEIAWMREWLRKNGK